LSKKERKEVVNEQNKGTLRKGSSEKKKKGPEDMSWHTFQRFSPWTKDTKFVSKQG